MLVLGLAIVGMSRTAAQTPPAVGTPPAVPTAKSGIATFNITYVMKHYTKFQTFEAELKAAIQVYQNTDTQLKQKGEEEAKKLTATTPPEQKELIQRSLTELQRKIEDNKMEAQKVMNKKQEEQLKILYLDVRQHVARLAASNGYQLVMHYNDAITDADYMSIQNIARKLQAGALMPIYMANGVDISRDLVMSLNAAYTVPPKR
jgi:Skp family chaperone for outer membrane proteins